MTLQERIDQINNLIEDKNNIVLQVIGEPYNVQPYITEEDPYTDNADTIMSVKFSKSRRLRHKIEWAEGDNLWWVQGRGYRENITRVLDKEIKVYKVTEVKL